MSRNTLQAIAVRAYGCAARTGLMSTPIARSLFIAAYNQYKRFVDASSADQLRKFVPEESTVIDVGANIGFFTTKFAQWVGPRGRVIAIEPDDENLLALRRVLSRSGTLRQVDIIAAVAADQRGRLKLERNELHPGDHKIATGPEGIDVAAVTLDDIAAERQAHIGFIKIDVQGAELMVLRGARRILHQDKPALFVEVDDQALARYGDSANGLITLLIAEGYTMNLLANDGSLTPFEQTALALGRGRRGYTDLLCLHADGH